MVLLILVLFAGFTAQVFNLMREPTCRVTGNHPLSLTWMEKEGR
ncbi:hypothetical protein ACK6VM_18760 [Citrobacter meridianamericanus]